MPIKLFIPAIPTTLRRESMSLLKISWLILCTRITDIRRGNHKKHMNALCGKNARFLKFTADGDELITGIETDKEMFLLGMHKINKPVLIIVSKT
jgi:hypothetical protein